MMTSLIRCAILLTFRSSRHLHLTDSKGSCPINARSKPARRELRRSGDGQVAARWRGV
jgi:hypothetical protein